MIHPKQSKGVRTSVEVCCAAWIDLLGYGAMLRDAEFDPTSPQALAAVSRLNRFHSIVYKSASKYSTSMIINDGAVIGRDLSPRSNSVTFDFVRRVQEMHQSVNDSERSEGHPGARCVLAAGFRIRRQNPMKQNLLTGYAKYLIDRVLSGEMSVLEGINSAITVKPFVAANPEFQANFAFSKAYLIDSAGSSAGFAGPRMFIDLALFSNEKTSWISLGDPIEWESPGISGRFAELKQIDTGHAGKVRYDGMRDAFQVAEMLAKTNGVLDRIKALRIGG